LDDEGECELDLVSTVIGRFYKASEYEESDVHFAPWYLAHLCGDSNTIEYNILLNEHSPENTASHGRWLKKTVDVPNMNNLYYSEFLTRFSKNFRSKN
jgi:hypothetical protein